MPLTNAGRDLIAAMIIGEAATPMNAANGYLGVGDSTTAFAVAQTDLQAASNKFRKILSGAPGWSTNVLTFVAAFATGEANFAWQEVAVFNASSAGTMLCRVVQSLGTKASGTWTLTHTVTVTA